MSTAPRYRYPGVKPFERTDSTIFFGRDRDRDDMVGLIALERLTVLFGKSGYGKSSLLNAAIVPRLEATRGYTAIHVRMTSSGAENHLSPTDLIVGFLDEKSPVQADMEFLDTLCRERSLWYHFKRRQRFSRTDNRPEGGWLLVFDQFEEFFLQSPGWRKQFEEQLAELLYTEVPQDVLDASLDRSDAEIARLIRPPDVRVVFGIRADRLGDLDSMKTRLPAILHKRFKLKGLSPEQARAAIIEPAALEHDEARQPFISPAFIYSPEALQIILQRLADGQQDSSDGLIEAFQLQILCQYIEGLVAAEGIVEIWPEHLPDFGQMYQAYYRQKLEQLPQEQRQTARRLIEEELLYENPQTGEARRISLDKDVLLQKSGVHGATEQLLRELENTFLLRREPNTFGGYNYEISHDTLIAPVLEAKAERRAEQERLAEVEARRNKEEELRSLREKAETERRKRRKATLLAFLAGLGFVVATVFGFWAYSERENARVAQETALREAQKARDELNARKRLEIKEWLRSAETYLASRDYHLARQALLNAQSIDSADTQVRELLRKLPKQ